MVTATRSDKVLAGTRWVAALVIPFLIVAFIILYGFPQQTGALFAWKIQPAMSAMMLAAAYMGGIYFFARVLLTKQWHKVKVGFLPVTIFASLLGLATILHWDRFNHSHVSFFAWAALYFTTPIIVLFVWLRNRVQDPGYAIRPLVMLPRWVRWLIGTIGMITLCIAVVLFLLPGVMMSAWPWKLTPLTARVMSAMFALPGVVGLGIALDGRWSASRIILESQGFSIAFILLAVARASSDFDWAKPGSWMFVVGLGGMLASIIVLYLVMQARYGGAAVNEPPDPRLQAPG